MDISLLTNNFDACFIFTSVIDHWQRKDIYGLRNLSALESLKKWMTCFFADWKCFFVVILGWFYTSGDSTILSPGWVLQVWDTQNRYPLNWNKFEQFVLMLHCHFIWSVYDTVFYRLIPKSFQSDEEWRLFYCDSTLGCRVQIRGLVTSQDGNKIMKYIWSLFLHRTKTLHSCYTRHKVQMICPLWHFHGLQAPSIQRVKSKFPSKNCYLWANLDITQDKHMKVC